MSIFEDVWDWIAGTSDSRLAPTKAERAGADARGLLMSRRQPAAKESQGPDSRRTRKSSANVRRPIDPQTKIAIQSLGGNADKLDVVVVTRLLLDAIQRHDLRQYLECDLQVGGIWTNARVELHRALERKRDDAIVRANKLPSAAHLSAAEFADIIAPVRQRLEEAAERLDG